MLITPEQIRAARALLRLDEEDLAKRAHVSVRTVQQLDTPGGAAKVPPVTVDEVCRTLESAGAEFIDRGVRRRTRTPEEVEERYRAIMAIARRSAAMQANLPRFTEDDLYDENGLWKQPCSCAFSWHRTACVFRRSPCRNRRWFWPVGAATRRHGNDWTI
jgi:transcriptional regulator with XRE-family HTH domain